MNDATTKSVILRCGAIALTMLVVVGCGQPEAEFSLNLVRTRIVENEMGTEENPLGAEHPRVPIRLTEENFEEISTALTAMFGTPDEPYLLLDDEGLVAKVLNLDLLRLGAGPVGSDEDGTPHGLYREHCAHCHGVTGDGAGPTAIFLNPYPRDYREGLFKFKSTPLGIPPTHDDLLTTLEEGIPGTAMPSFKLLDDDELEVLVQYVKYLAIRGEVEERLIIEVSEEDAIDMSAENLTNYLVSVARKWEGAASMVMPVEQPSANYDEENQIALGRELFFGAGTCAKCHGDTQLGDGQTTDYDEWTKPWAVSDDGTLESNDVIQEFRELGAFPPRNILPRNLRLGVFRGGRRPVDIYRRIRNGIEGTPMPGQQLLSADEVWYLVYYVLDLQHEPLSRRRVIVAEQTRDIN